MKLALNFLKWRGKEYEEMFRKEDFGICIPDKWWARNLKTAFNLDKKPKIGDVLIIKSGKVVIKDIQSVISKEILHPRKVFLFAPPKAEFHFKEICPNKLVFTQTKGVLTPSEMPIEVADKYYDGAFFFLYKEGNSQPYIFVYDKEKKYNIGCQLKFGKIYDREYIEEALNTCRKAGERLSKIVKEYNKKGEQCRPCDIVLKI